MPTTWDCVQPSSGKDDAPRMKPLYAALLGGGVITLLLALLSNWTGFTEMENKTYDLRVRHLTGARGVLPIRPSPREEPGALSGARSESPSAGAPSAGAPSAGVPPIMIREEPDALSGARSESPSAGAPSAGVPPIVIVAIDDESLARMEREAGFGVRWPFPRDIHAALIDFLAAGGARAIAFDVLFVEEDKEHPERDRALVDSTRRAGNVYLAALIRGGQSNAVAPERDAPGGPFPFDLAPFAALKDDPNVTLPYARLMEVAAGIGTVAFTPDADGVARRAPPLSLYQNRIVPSLSMAVARDLLSPALPPHASSRGPVAPAVNPEAPIIKWYGKAGHFPYYPVRDLLYSHAQLRRGEMPLLDPEVFRGKIVWIGATAAGLTDLRATPMSSIYPGVEMNATLLQNLLRRETIHPVGRGVVSGLTALLAIVPFWSVLRWPAFHAHLPKVVGLSALYGITVMACFVLGDLWLPVVSPFWGVMLAYTSGLATNYLTEARERQKVHGLFARYVSPDVVRTLLHHTERIRLGGVRREMTVLFADIRGFTAFAERMRPEAVVQQLNEFLSTMVEVIFANGGCLDKYMGDAVMAFWGAPVEAPQHAERACRAAWAMLAALDALNARWRMEGKSPMDIGIGIHTGEMIVGNIGSERRMDYTVIGDSVNLAARLEVLNKEWGTHILISRATCHAAGAMIKVRPLGAVSIKGRTEAVEIYTLENVG